MKFDIWVFLLASLAVWRIGNMISDIDQAGPFGVLDWIRLKIGVKFDTYSVPFTERGSLADLMMCIYCNSLWIGVVFLILILINQTLTIIVSLPFALSAVAIILQEFINGRSKMG